MRHSEPIAFVFGQEHSPINASDSLIFGRSNVTKAAPEATVFVESIQSNSADAFVFGKPSWSETPRDLCRVDEPTLFGSSSGDVTSRPSTSTGPTLESAPPHSSGGEDCQTVSFGNGEFSNRTAGIPCQSENSMKIDVPRSRATTSPAFEVRPTSPKTKPPSSFTQFVLTDITRTRPLLKPSAVPTIQYPIGHPRYVSVWTSLIPSFGQRHDLRSHYRYAVAAPFRLTVEMAATIQHQIFPYSHNLPSFRSTLMKSRLHNPVRPISTLLPPQVAKVRQDPLTHGKLTQTNLSPLL